MGNASSGLPFDVGSVIECENYLWSLNEGTTKTAAGITSAVTVFRFLKTAGINADRIECARRGWHKLRSLKHPMILAFVDGTELDDSIVMATEAAVPLSVWLKKRIEELNEMRKSSSSQGKSAALEAYTTGLFNEVIWGMRCITEALQFVHRTVKLNHGLVDMNAIFVTQMGDWKLGSLDLACDVTTDEHFFASHMHMLPELFQSPERKDGSWRSLFTGTLFGPIDVYSLGCVFRKLFQDLDLDTPAQLSQYLKKMLSVDAKRRATTAQFLKCPSLQSDFCRTMEAINELHLKTPPECIAIIDGIAGSSGALLSPAVCSFKVLPALVGVLNGAVVDFPNRNAREPCRQKVDVVMRLLDLFAAHGKIESEPFEKACPVLVELWSLSDRAIRTSLLKSLRNISKLMGNDLISNTIFDQILVGFTDSSAIMREETLKALVFVVDKLDEDRLNDKLIKCISNLQMDAEPSIRTNAVIFFGRLVPKLKPAVRQRVVCTAFPKAMKDGFLHCRLSGIKALSTSFGELDSNLVVAKVMPQLIGLVMDRSADVREISLQLLDRSTELLRTNHLALCQSEEAAKASSPKKPPSSSSTAGAAANGNLSRSGSSSLMSTSSSDGSLSSMGGGAGAGAGASTSSWGSGAAGGSSWTSWAVSSISKTLESASTGDGSMSPMKPPQPTDAQDRDLDKEKERERPLSSSSGGANATASVHSHSNGNGNIGSSSSSSARGTGGMGLSRSVDQMHLSDAEDEEGTGGVWDEDFDIDSDHSDDDQDQGKGKGKGKGKSGGKTSLVLPSAAKIQPKPKTAFSSGGFNALEDPFAQDPFAAGPGPKKIATLSAGGAGKGASKGKLSVGAAVATKVKGTLSIAGAGAGAGAGAKAVTPVKPAVAKLTVSKDENWEDF